MNIAIGSDHRGVTLKAGIIDHLKAAGHTYQDYGAYTEEAVDYPDIAEEVGKAVSAGKADRGILICYTGIGMSISANKIKGVRAALCHSVESARMTRLHNDANVLCIGAMDADETLPDIVSTFLNTEFEGGRHLRRVEKIMALEA